MKTTFTILLSISFFISYGQNLITNGDFETYTFCPPGQDFLSNAEPWVNITTLTPDYFNACADTFPIGVPFNYFGYQAPSSGDAYAGIFAYQDISDFDVREYISAPLDEPLIANMEYSLQFNVSLCNISMNAVETIGAFFSEDDLLPISQYLVLAEPQVVHSGGALADTVDWMTISGTFVASGGESYITIGNFEDNDNCGLEVVQEAAFSDDAYYYIDDVILEMIPSLISEEEIRQTFVFPNPTLNELWIESPNSSQKEIVIYDLNSKLVLEESFTGSTVINTETLSRGLYFYEIRNQKRIIKKGKLSKE